MNEDELKRNKVLTDYTVKDLNEDPYLPYDDATFDVRGRLHLLVIYSMSQPSTVDALSLCLLSSCITALQGQLEIRACSARSLAKLQRLPVQVITNTVSVDYLTKVGCQCACPSAGQQSWFCFFCFLLLAAVAW